MNKFLLKRFKLLFLFLSITAIYGHVNAQVINSESFDGTTFPPLGWTLTVAGGPNALWVQRTAGIFPTCAPHSGAAMARFTARNTNPGTQQDFISPVIDYSNTNAVIPTVSLWIFRDSTSTSGDSLTILINTAASLTGAKRIGAIARSRYFNLPHNELANGWYEYSFNVPATFTTSTNYFILNGTSQNGANIYIDDVSWTSFPISCSGAPTAGTVTAARSLICGGSGNTSLSIIGGSVGFAGLAYQWQSSDSVAGPWVDFGTGLTIENSGTLTSSKYFRCYLTCTSAALTDTSNVVFVQVSPNPNPTVAITPGFNVNYCSGGSPIILVVSGATTYTWNTNPTLTLISNDSASVVPTNNSNYVVVGSDAFGCTGTANVNVGFRTNPIITVSSSASSVCAGEPVTLQAVAQGGGPGGGAQFTWSPVGLTGGNIVVNPTAITTYFATGTNQFGCSTTDSITIGIASPAVANFGSVTNGHSVSFSDSSQLATSWQWSFGDGNISFSQNPIYTYSTSGVYNVMLIVSNGICTPDTIIKTITIVTIGINEFTVASQLQSSPNPTSDKTKVEFISNDGKAKIRLQNSLGQSMMTKTIYPIAGNHFKIDISLIELPSGIYCVIVDTDSGKGMIQVVKQ